MTQRLQRSVSKLVMPKAAALLALATYAAQSLALGVGEAEVHSTLNAPLRATLPLVDADGIQPGLLNVSVADESAFRELGVTRTPLAASVSLDVEQRRGQMVVELATERPVRDPWLDLLLRFDWPGGRQVREVTLLIDPPDYASMPVLVGAGERLSPRGADEADASPGAPQPEPVAPQVPPAAEAARVRSGDTLWSVATRLRPDDSVSLHQTMVALLEANPDAFAHRNINAMRAGVTLALPERDAIAARSNAEATRLVAEMNQAWEQRAGGAPAEVPLGDSEVRAESRGEPEPPADDAEPAAVSVEEEAPRLTLLSDAEMAAEAVAAGAERAGTVPEAPEREEDLPEAVESAGDIPPEEARLARLEQQWRESRESLEAVREERDRLHETLAEVQEEVAALRTRLSSLAAAQEARPAEAGRPPEAVSPPPSASPWWQGLLPSWPHLALGGAALAALAGIWLFVRRRRETAGATLADAMPAGAGPVAAPTPPASTAFAQEPLPQAEAISEADIFIAYGRYDQARELLETSLARDPERDDMRLKLVSVHLAQGNRTAAEGEGERLRASEDPAVRAEVERLLGPDARRAASPGDESPEAAVDAASREDDDPASPAAGQVEGPRPEQDTREQAPSAAAEPAAAPPDAGGQAGEDRAPEEQVSDEQVPPAAAADKAPPPPSADRRREPDIIDYQPPRLDPEPAPREETPMQPGIDFTTEPAGSEEEPAGEEREPTAPADAGEASSSNVRSGADEDRIPPDEEWEVEEVSFPPLDPDNGELYANAAREQLDEARRLIEAGEPESARELLGKLLLDDDPAIGDEAATLLTRLD